jgi:orotidine-5'-phosphate decarboxylase
MQARSSLCVALDGSDREWILSTARILAKDVGWFKLGLEAFTAHGPALVDDMAAVGPQVFLDLKLHDIPATVARASANCAALGAAMLTVHASGGRAMIEAAVNGVRRASPDQPPKVVAVTVLTSLDRKALAELGLEPAPVEIVAAWSRLAQDSGADGVVCSGREAGAVRSACGGSFMIVTPGIRPAASAANDQRRVATPGEALQAGADILVVGRPITGASDPAVAARSIVAEMASAG